MVNPPEGVGAFCRKLSGFFTQLNDYFDRGMSTVTCRRDEAEFADRYQEACYNPESLVSEPCNKENQSIALD